MSRIRTIKPEFHKHEELSALPAETHLLAAALLNYADDEGYFNAHPGLVKAECSPLREASVTVPVSLQSLSDIGYLRLGTGNDGKRYGQVVAFQEHQVISHPKTSKINSKEIVWDGSRNIPVIVQEHSILNGMEGKGREGKGMDSLSPDGDGDLKEAVSLYNLMAKENGLSAVQVFNGVRPTKLRARLKDCGGIEGWKAALEKVAGNPWLKGENKDGWRADFDFMLQKKSFTKLMEGAYERGKGGGGGNGFAQLHREYIGGKNDE